MLFLVNPGRKGRRMAKRRGKRKGKMPAALAAYWAGKRRKKSTSKRGRTMARKRKRVGTRRRRRSTKVAVRRRRRSVARRPARRVRRRSTARRRSSRRRVRRNPGFGGFSARGIFATLKEGLVGAVGVKAGAAGVRAFRTYVPFGGGSAVGELAKGAVGAIVVHRVAKMFAPRMAAYALAGAMAEVISPYLSQVPVVGPLLGDDSYLGYGNTRGSYLGAYAGGARGSMGAYAGSFSAYPALVGISGDEGE